MAKAERTDHSCKRRASPSRRYSYFLPQTIPLKLGHSTESRHAAMSLVRRVGERGQHPFSEAGSRGRLL
jgi:hypothetical protein